MISDHLQLTNVFTFVIIHVCIDFIQSPIWDWRSFWMKWFLFRAQSPIWDWRSFMNEMITDQQIVTWWSFLNEMIFRSTDRDLAKFFLFKKFSWTCEGRDWQAARSPSWRGRDEKRCNPICVNDSSIDRRKPTEASTTFPPSIETFVESEHFPEKECFSNCFRK